MRIYQGNDAEAASVCTLLFCQKDNKVFWQNDNHRKQRFFRTIALMWDAVSFVSKITLLENIAYAKKQPWHSADESHGCEKNVIIGEWKYYRKMQFGRDFTSL